MATTYTSNYQLKEIGTGEEASTWGVSTNTTWATLEEMIGGGAEVQVSSPGPASNYTAASNTLEWITSNTSTAGQPNSQGRAAFVTFVDGSGSFDLGTEAVVEIWGDTALLKVKRVFFVKNDLTAGRDIVLKCGSGATSYTLANGAFTAVYVDGNISVVGVLEDLQVSKLDFRSSGSGVVELQDDTGNAFNLKEGTNSYVNVNTDAKSVIIGADTGSDCNLLDVRTVAGLNLNFCDDAYVKIEESNATALRIRGYTTGDDYITLNTSSKSIELGDSAVNILDIDTSAITTTTQATTWELKTGSVALDFLNGAGGASFVKLDTTPDTNKVTITGDCAITGTLDITGDVMGGTTYDGTVIINKGDPAIDVTNQASQIRIKNGVANSLNFISGPSLNEAWLKLDTDDDKVFIGQEAGGGPIELDIDVPTINVATQATDFVMKESSSAALDFISDGESYLKFYTTNGSEERVEFGKPISGASGGTITTAAGLTVGSGLTVTAGTSTFGGKIVTTATSASGDINCANVIRLETNAKGLIGTDAGGADASLVTLGASDQLAIGSSTAVDSIELLSSADSFKVKVGGGGLKSIWHDDTTELVSASAVDWKLPTSATALELKNAEDATKFTFDTTSPKIILVNDSKLVIESAAGSSSHGSWAGNDAPVATMDTDNVLRIGTSGNNYIEELVLGVSANANDGTGGDAAADLLKYAYGAGLKKVWHEGNDGPDSGLNADMLDGAHLADIMSHVLGTRSATGGQDLVGRLLLDDGTLLVQWGYTKSISSAATGSILVTEDYDYPAEFDVVPFLMLSPNVYYSDQSVIPYTWGSYAQYATSQLSFTTGSGTFSTTATTLTTRIIPRTNPAGPGTFAASPFIAIGTPA